MAAQDSSDEELLTRSVSRPDLFAAFYHRHAENILGFFARRTLDPHVAADLTAETFAEAFASRRRFRTRGEGSAKLLPVISSATTSGVGRSRAAGASAPACRESRSPARTKSASTN